ncbi:App1 family protein [Flavobacterium sp. '19STA2R22 D10 B1']|uniref:App1 family protein n=1 Tax=Flavobacterium aerium TaxID=3037261 RepID=UPI00278BB552|nr:App1 family protein [Flavobacterium sp. '19STA2R22 D10 B1']
MKPTLKLYRGYANDQELIVMGHAFKRDKASTYEFEKKSFKHAAAIIRMFRIKTISNADVYLDCHGVKIHTKTLDDGLFQFSIPLNTALEGGWHDYQVTLHHNGKEIVSKGTFIKPHEGKLGFISDIDDTFLISHTRNIFKKIYILLWRNINARKLFDDVVPHYQALSSAGRNNIEEKNAFFYVSSSEWNLYRFIVQFTELHELPRAVLLLKDIKTSLLDFLFTGRGSHDHKFEKIKHILEFYPHLKYVLLGDDSQQDPFLYESICKIFPVSLKAVYIRQTTSLKKQKVILALENIESMGVAICYFRDSQEAIEHSKKIGLID